LAGFALTEPNAGSDAGAVSTQARREGDEYVLNGEKCFISSGDLAALYVVFATVDKSKGVGGITGFLLPGDTKGISRGKIEDKMGFHSNHTGVVVLNDVRIPVEDRLGEEGSGFMIAMKLLEIARVISCGVVGVGLARGAYETTLKFLKTHSDAKTLMMQQPISFDLADMLASIEATRLLVWKACWMLDNELPSGAMSALTKFYASDMALEIANKGMQLVGPHAYTEEYHLDKLVRDAKLLQIYEGTNQISRLVVSRDILSR
jgi:acyl-CoA dehydrogenase